MFWEVFEEYQRWTRADVYGLINMKNELNQSVGLRASVREYP
jgi:hypothetical protein